MTGLMLVTAALASAARGADLRTELENLSRQHGFSIEGLDSVGPEDAPQAATDELAVRLRDLLGNYNHLMVSGHGRAVEKVVILGAKGARPSSPANATVSITRDGVHHRVEALLTGPNRRIIPVSLIIDTGASNIVLPESMIEALGFRREDLQAATSHTASGMLPVQLAKLKTVAVGRSEITDVGVSFVEDRKLGNLALLGMSFLSRFRFTIDDEKNELILLAR